MDQNNSPWNLDNSSLFVVACMKLLMRVCPNPAARAGYISGAHGDCKGVSTDNQAAYDLAFGNALLTGLLANGEVEKEHIDHWNLWQMVNAVEQPAQPIQLTVATEIDREQVEIDPNDKSKWTVEQWAASGLRFKPAAAEIGKTGNPTVVCFGRRKTLPGQDLEEKADELAGTFPWGGKAADVALWGWRAAGYSAKPREFKVIELARVLSALYCAGVISDGAMIPVGYGQKDQVRPNYEKMKKRKK